MSELEKVARHMEQAIKKRDERIQQLEEALRVCRQVLQDIVDECGVEGSWPEVEGIEKADAALSNEAPPALNARLYVRGRGQPKPYPLDEDEISEAPEKEGEDG